MANVFKDQCQWAIEIANVNHKTEKILSDELEEIDAKIPEAQRACRL